ncbi:hypothetical protein AMECASPLE_023131 [Ameca splendens]|uniref:Uncharacterized protein n=1 Tax=Ameca splendens TaxID=208324 RepID=A0ABV0Z3Z8_9TELE
MYKRGVHMAQSSPPTGAAPGRSSPDPPTSSDPNPMSLPAPVNPNKNLPTGPPPTRTPISNTSPKPKCHESPPPQGHAPTGELHGRESDEATPTRRKLHTQPRSKNPCCTPLPHHTARCNSKARPRATPPPPTGATGQTPPSTAPTTGPPTPHHDGTNSSTKRSPASGRHPGPVSPTTPPSATKNTTSLLLQRLPREKHYPAQLHHRCPADPNTSDPTP